MSNNEKKVPQGSGQAVSGQFVKVANGAGNDPVSISWQPGDTVASVLERAGITIEKGRTATIGRRRVRNPAKTEIQPDEVIVIAGKPSNG